MAGSKGSRQNPAARVLGKVRLHDNDVGGSENSRRDVPLSEIWNAITSELGAILSIAEQTSTTSPLDASTPAEPTPTEAVPPTGEIMTITEIIPISTVTVESTSYKTTFITVRSTTDGTPTPAPHPPSTRTRSTSWTSSSASSAVLPPIHTSSSRSRTRDLPPPTFAASGEPSGTTSGAPAATQHDPSVPSSASGATAAGPGSQKHAVIGGLSGSIAGLLFIGVILCLLWRRRKPRFPDEDPSFNEKGIRPSFLRKWSEFSSGEPRPQVPPPTAVAAISRRSSHEPEPDGILRVSLDNWARPYAHEAGWRESQGPTTLRVTNPDLSRPSTPLRPSIETAGSFLKRQRNALAAALYGRPNSSRTDVQSQHQHQHHSLPAPQLSSIDPTLSSEFLAPKAIATSIRSGSTGHSVPIVMQRPPEDPFLTHPDERARGTAHTTRPAPVASRPSIAPLQGAAGAAGRTLSHLNPFRRTHSNASASSRARSASRQSAETFSSFGDPFMLDRASIPVARMGRDGAGGGSANVSLYSGT